MKRQAVEEDRSGPSESNSGKSGDFALASVRNLSKE